MPFCSSSSGEARPAFVDDLAAVVVDVLWAIIRGTVETLEDAYDGRPCDALLGTPDEARTIRALTEQGDAEYVLREHRGLAGEDALLDRVALPSAGEALAVQVKRLTEHRVAPGEERALTGEPGERDADPAGFDFMTHVELRDWMAAWLPATDTIAEHEADRQRAEELASLGRDVEDETAALRDLLPADLLLLAASDYRGFAANDPETYRRLNTVRRRVRRRTEKDLGAVSD